MEPPQILPQHEWLTRLAGEWRSECEMPGADGAFVTLHGRESVRPVGEIWLQLEGHSEMPDGTKGHLMMTLGFNPGTGRFVGSWLGSCMNQFWIYDGELDAARRKLTLQAEGPSFEVPGATTLYRDVITLIDDNHRTLTSMYRSSEGKWEQMMVVHYFRK